MIDPQYYLALVFWIYAFMFGQLSSGERGRKRYKRLSGVPPPWLFAVVWTVLNVCLGIAAWTSLQHTENYANVHHYRAAVALWLVYLVTLKMWNVAFDGKWSYGPVLVCIAALLMCLGLVAMSATRFAYSSSSFDILWPFIVLVVASAWHIFAVYLASTLRDFTQME